MRATHRMAPLLSTRRACWQLCSPCAHQRQAACDSTYRLRTSLFLACLLTLRQSACNAAGRMRPRCGWQRSWSTARSVTSWSVRCSIGTLHVIFCQLAPVFRQLVSCLVSAPAAWTRLVTARQRIAKWRCVGVVERRIAGRCNTTHQMVDSCVLLARRRRWPPAWRRSRGGSRRLRRCPSSRSRSCGGALPAPCCCRRWERCCDWQLCSTAALQTSSSNQFCMKQGVGCAV